MFKVDGVERFVLLFGRLNIIIVLLRIALVLEIGLIARLERVVVPVFVAIGSRAILCSQGCSEHQACAEAYHESQLSECHDLAVYFLHDLRKLLFRREGDREFARTFGRNLYFHFS